MKKHHQVDVHDPKSAYLTEVEKINKELSSHEMSLTSFEEQESDSSNSKSFGKRKQIEHYFFDQ